MVRMNIETLVNEIKHVTGAGVEVYATEIQKGNVTLTGIVIGNGEVRPTAYVENYENMFTGCNYTAVATKIVKDAREAMKENNLPNKGVHTSYAYAKTHFQLCIAPKGTNVGLVTYPYLDLTLYVRVMVENPCVNKGFIGSYKVTANMLNYWKISKETLFHMALDCTKPTYECISMAEEFGFPTPVPMIIVSNQDKNYGASVMYCKEILKGITDKFDDDLIILPSSIHEIIVIPASTIDIEEMSEMVTMINATDVDPTEVLSDHAYIFHRDTMEITY